MAPHPAIPTPLEQELREQLHAARERMEPPPVERFLLGVTAQQPRPGLQRWVVPVLTAVLVAVLTGSALLLALPSSTTRSAPDSSNGAAASTPTGFPRPGSLLQSRPGIPNGLTVPLGGQTLDVIGRAGHERLALMTTGSSNCRFEPAAVSITSSTTVSVRLRWVGHPACNLDLKAVTTVLGTPGVDDTRPTTVSVTLDAAPGNPAHHYIAILPPAR